MHGSSFNGDAPAALLELAALYDAWLRDPPQGSPP
jgi:hypothetical protein